MGTTCSGHSTVLERLDLVAAARINLSLSKYLFHGSLHWRLGWNRLHDAIPHRLPVIHGPWTEPVYLWEPCALRNNPRVFRRAACECVPTLQIHCCSPS